MTTDLSAALAAIRERAEYAKEYMQGDPMPPSLEDVPRLLKAVEDALELAGKLEPQGSPASALEEDRMFIREECADMIREAITTALTGQGAGSDEQ